MISPQKPKLTGPRAPRLWCTLELAIEPGMEERLERLKSRIQVAKSSLFITNGTPMGNVLLMEQLVDSLEWSEHQGKVSDRLIAPCFHFVKMVLPVAIKHVDLPFDFLEGKIRQAVLMCIPPVDLRKTVFLLRQMP